MSHPLQAVTATTVAPQQLMQRAQPRGAEAAATAAVLPVFAEAARGTQPLTLGSPRADAAASSAKEVITRERLAPIPLDHWQLIAKQGKHLFYKLPDIPGVFTIDTRAHWANQWLPFAYKRKVFAPNPHRNNEFCLGEMLTPNRHVTFEPEDAPDETIPYLIVDFTISTRLFTGIPAPSVDRRQIWPA